MRFFQGQLLKEPRDQGTRQPRAATDPGDQGTRQPRAATDPGDQGTRQASGSYGPGWAILRGPRGRRYPAMIGSL